MWVPGNFVYVTNNCRIQKSHGKRDWTLPTALEIGATIFYQCYGDYSYSLDKY